MTAAPVLHSPGNLPVQLTSFVGRRKEHTAIKQQLSASRLVTLTGFGGVGKTRLALRAAHDMRRAFPDGVWFVDLSALSNPALLADTAATSLGLRGPWPNGALDVLAEFLGARSCLLVLDNCEHLVDVCAGFAGGLLRTCPDLRVLATSRQPLGITGERILPVHPLSLPADTQLSPDALSQVEAVALFSDRAAAVLPGFSVTEGNGAEVAAICRQLEGIPLALELAAVRLRGLSLGQILERLTDRFRLLTAGSRGAPDRQRTLRGCIDWSYELCTPEEQELWNRVSVFSGGFEIDAAESVCADGLLDDAVLDTLLSLVDKSVLVRDEYDGQVRYRMLEVLRQHGEQRLRVTGDWTTMQRRHRDFYAELVHRATADWLTEHQIGWMRRLRREHANVRSVLAYCLEEPGGVDVGCQIAAGLQEQWVAEGQFDEGRHWLDRLLATSSAPSLPRLLAIRTAAWLACIQGDLAVAAAQLEEGRELATELGDQAGLVITLTSGLHAMYAGDLPLAIRTLEHVLDAFRASHDLYNEVQTLVTLGVAAGFANEIEQGLDCHRRCMELTEPAGESWFRSFSMWNAGLLANQLGDAEEAAKLVQGSLNLKQQVDDRLGIAMCLESLSWISLSTDPHRAATLLGAADAAFGAIGVPIDALPGMATQRGICEAQLRGGLGEATYERCFGQGRMLDRAAALDFAIGAKRPSRSHPKDARDPLTRREREVAALVARGLSNKDIATSLVISQRTAEGHVENILTKFGFSSRAQVASWVSAQHVDEHGDGES